MECAETHCIGVVVKCGMPGRLVTSIYVDDVPVQIAGGKADEDGMSTVLWCVLYCRAHDILYCCIILGCHRPGHRRKAGRQGKRAAGIQRAAGQSGTPACAELV